MKLVWSCFYAKIDFLQNYWRLRFPPNPQGCRSFIAPDLVFSIARVMHCTSNAWYTCSNAWVRPSRWRWSVIFYYGSTTVHYTAHPLHTSASVPTYFGHCAVYNGELHPVKCTLSTPNVRWCSCIVFGDGIHLGSFKPDDLLDIKQPILESKVQKCLSQMQWMGSSITTFQSLVHHLHGLLECVKTRAGNRSKKFGWWTSVDRLHRTADLTRAFDWCRYVIGSRESLAHPNDWKRPCIYNGASNTHKLGRVT